MGEQRASLKCELGELYFFQPIRYGQQNLLGALIVVVVLACVMRSDYVALSIEIAGNEGAEQHP